MNWINLLGYQLTWFVTVGSVKYDRAWIGELSALLFCAGQVLASKQRGLDMRLIASALLAGTVLDGALATTGLVSYASASPVVTVFGCPLWILGLWAAFATTLTRSLGWLRHRVWAAAVLGAVGGPLAYLGAARGWGALTLNEPSWRALLALALGWAVALVILVRVAADGSAGVSARDSGLARSEFS